MEPSRISGSVFGEGAGAIAQKNDQNVVGFIRYQQINRSVVIHVGRGDRRRIASNNNGGGSLKGSVPVAQNDGDGAAINIRDSKIDEAIAVKISRRYAAWAEAVGARIDNLSN